MLPDGRLVFIGRIDNQIKIRGFRIEPQEIESVINQHPHIKQSSVVAKQGSHHIRYLTAYLMSNLQVERLPIHLPCLLQTAEDSPISLNTDNISCGGIALNDVIIPLRKQQKVEIRLRLPDMPTPIMQAAEVSWYKDQQAGLKFVDYTQETYLLCEHVESMLHNQGFIKALQRNVVDELRTMLKAKLPDYMLPENYTFLDEFPLTNNGKIDRQALEKLDHEQLLFDNDQGFTAPRTPLQQQLANIWQQLLQIKRASIYDDFFALGGNSLAAMQAINQISEAFQVDANSLSLFDIPTIAKQAELVEQATNEGGGLIDLPPITSTQQTSAPLSYPQQQIWLLSQMTPHVPLYNEPCTIYLGSFIDIKILEKSVNEIRSRHAMLRTTFMEQDGQLLQIINPFVPETLSIVDLSMLPEASQQPLGEQVFTEMLRKPFDLTQDSLFRCFLLRLNAQDTRLCMAMHHIIFDGVSMQILFDELEALYLAFLQKKTLLYLNPLCSMLILRCGNSKISMKPSLHRI